MLTVTRLVAAATTAVLVTAAGCGSQRGAEGQGESTRAAQQAAEAQDACEVASNDPQVLGDAERVSLTVSIQTTAAAIDEWLAAEAKLGGGPLESVRDFAGLGDPGPEADMAVCLLSGPPRPIPSVAGSKSAVADGVLALVRDQAVVIYGLGPIGALTEQVERLGRSG